MKTIILMGDLVPIHHEGMPGSTKIDPVMTPSNICSLTTHCTRREIDASRPRQLTPAVQPHNRIQTPTTSKQYVVHYVLFIIK